MPRRGLGCVSHASTTEVERGGGSRLKLKAGVKLAVWLVLSVGNNEPGPNIVRDATSCSTRACVTAFCPFALHSSQMTPDLYGEMAERSKAPD